jgi:hypothetical protein
MALPVGVAASVLVCGLIATGCNQSPAAPSSRTTAAPMMIEPGSELELAAGAASLNPDDLEARGWDCRPAPLNPIRLTCSHPNQPHPLTLPGPPPPPDRPPSITLLVFDNGVFIGTSLLIRSDLYHDQPCKSTGGAYTTIARIGYRECLHRSQAN